MPQRGDADIGGLTERRPWDCKVEPLFPWNKVLRNHRQKWGRYWSIRCLTLTLRLINGGTFFVRSTQSLSVCAPCTSDLALNKAKGGIKASQVSDANAASLARAVRYNRSDRDSEMHIERWVAPLRFFPPHQPMFFWRTNEKPLKLKLRSSRFVTEAEENRDDRYDSTGISDDDKVGFLSCGETVTNASPKRRLVQGKHRIRPYPRRATASPSGSDDNESGSEQVQAIVIPQNTAVHRRRNYLDSKPFHPIVIFTAIILYSVLGLLLIRNMISARPHTYDVDHIGDSQLQQLVQRVIVQVSKDLIGRRDFALQSSGGSVVHLLTTGAPDVNATQVIGQTESQSTVPVRQCGTNCTNPPEVALSDDLRMEYCWPIRNSSGQLGFMLSEMILVTHVTIDHLARDMTSDISSAPRRMVLWGVIDGEDNMDKVKSVLKATGDELSGPPITGGYTYIKLQSFSYDIDAPFHIQTFPMIESVVALGLDIGVLVLEILDNWGGPSTCLYRVRIHGERLMA